MRVSAPLREPPSRGTGFFRSERNWGACSHPAKQSRISARSRFAGSSALSRRPAPRVRQLCG
eukprot:3784747-Prymnesium_polylepis.1